MEVLSAIKDVKRFLSKSRGKTIGFVPTMGALHDGHIQLVNRALGECDLVVCSIFVNPAQFNNPVDLEKYPRTLESDTQLLDAAGCHVVFAPTVSEMYPQPAGLTFSFGYLETILEGEFRPGHFNGVGLVVSKLFHIVEPQKAYFGQKDLQQVAVIRTLINSLNFEIELIVCDTKRETSGLAMSSRNKRLTGDGKVKAAAIYTCLQEAKGLFISGKNKSEVLDYVHGFFKSKPEFRLEYFEIASSETLLSINEYNENQSTAMLIAIFLEDVRLIDNIVF
ncbi:MAG: pantoate--beta-alanine ligase [Leadbetterella sp.]